MRYVLELWRTDDDRVEGFLAREGVPRTTAFSGWLELFGLLEPPPLDIVEPAHPKGEEGWPCPRPS